MIEVKSQSKSEEDQALCVMQHSHVMKSLKQRPMVLIGEILTIAATLIILISIVLAVLSASSLDFISCAKLVLMSVGLVGVVTCHRLQLKPEFDSKRWQRIKFWFNVFLGLGLVGASLLIFGS